MRGCDKRDVLSFRWGDTECPLQVCQLIRSSESTRFRFLRIDVDFVVSTRAPDSF